MREHLPRLDTVWREPPIFFVTICTHRRRRILANDVIAAVLLKELRDAPRHRWMIGRYVIMPDHVHFFCAPQRNSKTLSQFVGAWKSWTSRRIGRLLPAKSGGDVTREPIWQAEFFDHLLRSNESYDQKWEYVRDNPVRASFVSRADAWKYAGEIERLSL